MRERRGDHVRIAAVADIHCTKTSQGLLQPLFAQAAQHADVLLLCGDLTDYGTPEEARVLAQELSGPVRVPVLAVLGNHDHESGQADVVRAILQESRVIVLDGDVHEIRGVGFAGVKGFCGGFGQRTLEPWGEAAIKLFVKEATDEAMKLEKALSRLSTPRRIAVLHYAPVVDTVQGEPLEIFPFLGSSRLEEPLNRYAVTACFHGHAHRGAPEGRTEKGAPVYNVALPLLRRLSPERPLRLFEVPVVEEAAEVGALDAR